jgi:soluble lytic murein transglycosylase-like protein
MPAPVPTSIELNSGLTQWGAESDADEDQQSMNRDAMMATLLELARPFSKTTSKVSMCETLAEAAQTHNLPVGFFVRLINQESGFNPEAVSPVGAQGVAQFMPRVAEEWGLRNPFDPHQALVASARFLRSLFDQFGNWGLAAAAYNGGMGRVQKWVDKRGKLPDETRHYVMTITGVPADKWVNGKAQQAKFSIPARAPCQEIAHLADPPARDVDKAPAPAAPVTQVAVVTSTKGKRSKTVITSNTKVAKTGATSKMQVAVITTKGKNGGKVVVSKVAAVTGKIAAPATIIAEKSSGQGKRGKIVATVKVAKAVATVKVAKVAAAEKAPAKTSAKAKDTKKAPAKGRVQVADAAARK